MAALLRQQRQRWHCQWLQRQQCTACWCHSGVKASARRTPTCQGGIAAEVTGQWSALLLWCSCQHQLQASGCCWHGRHPRRTAVGIACTYRQLGVLRSRSWVLYDCTQLEQPAMPGTADWLSACRMTASSRADQDDVPILYSRDIAHVGFTNRICSVQALQAGRIAGQQSPVTFVASSDSDNHTRPQQQCRPFDPCRQ